MPFDQNISIELTGGAHAIQIEPVLILRRNDAFENAPDVVAQQAALFFETIKDEIAESARTKMREWRGDEKRDIQATVFPGIYNQTSLIVGGDLVQTYVDEFGLEARKCFPPWREGTLLFQWVIDKLAPQPLPVQHPRVEESKRLLNAQLSASFAVAVAINQRGLPAPADYLHEPFAATFEEFLPRVTEGLIKAGIRAASIINTSDAGSAEFIVHS
jgi:hypothetical protein